MISPFSVFNCRGVVEDADDDEVGGSGDVSDATMDATVLALEAIGVVAVVDVVVVGVPPNDDAMIDDEDGEIKKEVQVRLTFHVKLKNWYLE